MPVTELTAIKRELDLSNYRTMKQADERRHAVERSSPLTLTVLGVDGEPSIRTSPTEQSLFRRNRARPALVVKEGNRESPALVIHGIIPIDGLSVPAKISLKHYRSLSGMET